MWLDSKLIDRGRRHVRLLRQAHWDAQIGVKNITNVTYYTTAESAGGDVGLPRTYYAKASWHY